jgi:hypothetical protein
MFHCHISLFLLLVSHDRTPPLPIFHCNPLSIHFRTDRVFHCNGGECITSHECEGFLKNKPPVSIRVGNLHSGMGGVHPCLFFTSAYLRV